jgi:hypothetical protein
MPLELFGTIANPAKADAAPPNRLITNAKDWAGLQLAWGIKDPPKVDFTREMLVVATTNNDKLVIETDVDKAGDLHIRALDNGVETGGGFRYRIKAIDKAGIKTVEGVPLAKVLAAGPAAPVVPIPPPVLPPATVPRVPPPVVPPAVPPRVPPR